MRIKNAQKHWLLTAIFLIVGLCFALPSFSSQTNIDVTAGVEMRLRYVGTYNLPTHERTKSDPTSFTRVRTRPWIRASYENATFFLKPAHEFRHYFKPDSASSNQRWPDVLFIDNVYFQWENIFNDVDIKIGRQNIEYGEKRILSDGTGGDGTRSAFFDAARIIWHADKNRKLDILGIYQSSDDFLPTLGKKHEKGEEPYDYDLTGLKQDEFGLGLYWQDSSNKDFIYEAYYFAKGEYRMPDAPYRNEGCHDEFHTLGTRLLPRFTETIYGELELAGQAGSDIEIAGQGHAGLTWKPKETKNNSVTAACRIISGDKEGARSDHAWHVVFNRATGYGDTIAAMYHRYNYNNLVYPHLSASYEIGDFSSIRAQTGPMFTSVREDDSDGSYRGYYVQTAYLLDPEKLFNTDLPGDGSFRIHLEFFDKGNYFAPENDDYAFYGELQCLWNF